MSGSLLYLLNQSGEEPSGGLPSFAFDSLFYNNTSIVDASDLTLEALTANKFAYDALFWHCTNLVSPPLSVDAVTVGESSMAVMFADTAITYAPEIKATTLGYRSL